MALGWFRSGVWVVQEVLHLFFAFSFLDFLHIYFVSFAHFAF